MLTRSQTKLKLSSVGEINTPTRPSQKKRSKVCDSNGNISSTVPTNVIGTPSVVAKKRGSQLAYKSLTYTSDGGRESSTPAKNIINDTPSTPRRPRKAKGKNCFKSSVASAPTKLTDLENLQEWDIDKAVEYIESPIKPLTVDSLYSWMTKDDSVTSKKDAEEVSPPKLSNRYVETTVTTAEKRKNLCVEWFNTLERNPGWIIPSPSRDGNFISGKMVWDVLMKKSPSVSVGSDEENQALPIVQQVYYGTCVSYILVLKGCIRGSQKYCEVQPHLFKLWGGTVHGYDEKYYFPKMDVPFSIGAFIFDADKLASSTDNYPNVLEVCLCARDMRAMVPVTLTTSVGEVKKFCEYVFGLNYMEEKTEIYVSTSKLNLKRTVGEVFSTHCNESVWYMFCSSSAYDVDITLTDLKDHFDTDRATRELSWVPESFSDEALILSSFDFSF